MGILHEARLTDVSDIRSVQVWTKIGLTLFSCVIPKAHAFTSGPRDLAWGEEI